MRKSKKMKPGKLKGPSHKNGGILLEAEGGEYIIKKSSVKKIGKDNLDKINKEGKLPMARRRKTAPPHQAEDSRKKDIPIHGRKAPEVKPNPLTPARRRRPSPPRPIDNLMELERKRKKEMLEKIPPGPKKGPKRASVPKKRSGGKVGDSIKTYSSGGYIEGK